MTTTARHEETPTASRLRTRFHLVAPGGIGWVNDPNGCCQFKGIYHLYHQYMPNYPATFPRAWGHAWSDDLVRWHHTGLSLHEDTPFDAHGSFSGCALVDDTGQTMRVYYTGNFKEPGKHDFVYEGRWASQLTTTTDDGLHFSPKEVLLMPRDYPSSCSCHVRDPKVWQQNDEHGMLWHMMLGARSRDDKGFALLYDSNDGLQWHYRSSLFPKEYLGFMWECPDRLVFSDAQGHGHEYLSLCSQHTPEETPEDTNQHVSGYIPLPETLLGMTEIDQEAFVLWDYGFDFYAPQTFVDKSGRTILFGWMGMPDSPFAAKTDDMDFWHCITVPRLVTMDEDGLLRSNPVPELKNLRSEAIEAVNGCLLFAHMHADIQIDDIKGGFLVRLNNDVEFSCRKGEGKLCFVGNPLASGGRKERRCTLERARSLRILIDGSTIEIFVNDGRCAFATRWFPTNDTLRVVTEGHVGSLRGWTMNDGMSEVWDNVEAAHQAQAGIQGFA